MSLLLLLHTWICLQLGRPFLGVYRNARRKGADERAVTCLLDIVMKNFLQPGHIMLQKSEPRRPILLEPKVTAAGYQEFPQLYPTTILEYQKRICRVFRSTQYHPVGFLHCQEAWFFSTLTDGWIPFLSSPVHSFRAASVKIAPLSLSS